MTDPVIIVSQRDLWPNFIGNDQIRVTLFPDGTVIVRLSAGYAERVRLALLNEAGHWMRVEGAQDMSILNAVWEEAKKRRGVRDEDLLERDLL